MRLSGSSFSLILVLLSQENSALIVGSSTNASVVIVDNGDNESSSDSWRQKRTSGSLTHRSSGPLSDEEDILDMILPDSKNLIPMKEEDNNTPHAEATKAHLYRVDYSENTATVIGLRFEVSYT